MSRSTRDVRLAEGRRDPAKRGEARPRRPANAAEMPSDYPDEAALIIEENYRVYSRIGIISRETPGFSPRSFTLLIRDCCLFWDFFSNLLKKAIATNMLPQRLFTTIIWFLIIVLAIKYKVVFAICFMLLVVGGLYEFFTLIERKGIHIYKYFGIVIGTIIPLSILFRFELTKSWELLLIVLALVALFIFQFRRRDNSQAIVGISSTLFGILYVSWFFSFLIKIRDMSINGPWFLAAVLLITKSSDIGAYLIGSRFGRHALIPHISPKKSIEGSIGGLLFSMLAALVCKPFFSFTYMHLALLGVGLGILAELGDLSESLIKRDCQVKDSGPFFPGMGGVLDLIDSLLFTAPVFYFYLSAVLR